MWPAGLRLRPRLRDGASGAPPALQGLLRFTDSGTDCGRYTRPLVSSLEAGSDDDLRPGGSGLAEGVRHPDGLSRVILCGVTTRLPTLLTPGRWGAFPT